RTPLNAVIGLTNLALYSPEDSKKVTECLGEAADGTGNMLTVKLEKEKLWERMETPCWNSLKKSFSRQEKCAG
ncbi:hypothetical protein, partial [Enterocloster bolteae]|uniref:hypothetical protein n=1 Tax=Enterocloster bolteae TaxID=208479 RepID=UPI00210F0C0D